MLHSLFRGHHLLRAPLAKQRAQRCRLDWLVEHRDVFLTRSGADVRAAIGGNQDRRNAIAKPATDVADRGDAVAAIKMIVDQQAGDRSGRSLDRLDGGFGIGSPR